MNEPSVLDYIKSLFHSPENKRNSRLTLFSPERKTQKSSKLKKKTKSNPLKLVIAIILGVIAQSQLEPPNKQSVIAITLYFVVGILIWSEIPHFDFHRRSQRLNKQNSSVRMVSFILSLLFVLAAFWTFKNNQLTFLNLSLWVLAVSLFIFSVWEKSKKGNFKKPQIDLWIVIFILIIIVVAFFRLYQLDQIPGEMFSDHAEKLLDVADILKGQYSIFFPRNTGREAFQFYLTAIIIRLFGTGLTFISLKIGTALAGLLTLPFIYLLGRGGKD